HHRAQVQAAAHQPGRAPGRLQPDVRRARRLGAAPSHVAREGDRRLRVRRFLRRGDTAPRDVLARAGLHGDKVLAVAETTGGSWLFGTRDALVVVDPVETRRIAWE